MSTDDAPEAETGRGMSRRGFLAASAATATVAGLLPRSAAAAQGQVAPFLHGVASGDPLSDRVVLWTRVTPVPDATPGSGVGPESQVSWDVATDAGFTMIVASGTAVTDATRDHTVKVDVPGLEPGQDHWYRFRLGDAVSAAGRTRTLPDGSADVDEVRLGIVTCAEWEFGAFGAYARLAERDDIDLVLHLGDYIYEFGLGYGPVASPGASLGRNHEPPHETLTLADYRTRYGQYRTDPGTLALHASHPMVVMYDDHEIANDTWREGAENHTSPGEGAFADRATAARQAWREWLPIREQSPDVERVHRTMQFGQLLQLWMLDERRYRDAPPTSGAFSLASVDPAINDPSRTMLGLEQRAWLLDGMAATTAKWRVLGNPVPFIPQNVGPEVTTEVKALLGPITDGLPVARPAYYVDDWNGYVGERTILFEAFGQLDNVVVITGDYHESFASDLPADQGGYVLDGASVAVEFVAPSVTSPGYSETVSLSGAPLEVTSLIDTIFVANFTTSNPWVKFHDGFANGFGVASFTHERTQFDFHFVDDRTDPDTGAPVAASWQALDGDPHVTPAPAPLAARAPWRTPAPSTAPSTTTTTTASNGELAATGGRTNWRAIALTAAAGLGAAALRRRTRAD